MVATSSPKRIVNASGDMYDWSFEKQGEETKNAKYGYMSKAGAKRFRRLIPKTQVFHNTLILWFRLEYQNFLKEAENKTFMPINMA